MEKIGTLDCQLFIAAHYAQSRVDTETEDWILEKKYKNFHGFTCRDFINKKLGLNAVVVSEIRDNKSYLSVLENFSYKTFVDEMARSSLFYYVPVVTNDGLVFYFERTMTFNATGELSIDLYEQQKPYLLKTLSALFKKSDFSPLEVDMMVIFPNHEVEDVVKILENNNLSFNPSLFKLLNKKYFQPFIHDIDLERLSFPEDSKLSVDESIELIFALTSKKEELTNETYSRIKNLFKKVPLSNINNITKIILGFRPTKDIRLETIINAEINNKKNKLLWSEVILNG